MSRYLTTLVIIVPLGALGALISAHSGTTFWVGFSNFLCGCIYTVRHPW